MHLDAHFTRCTIRLAGTQNVLRGAIKKLTYRILKFLYLRRRNSRFAATMDVDVVRLLIDNHR